MPNVFELAELDEKGDAEKSRQAARAGEAGYESVDKLPKGNVFEQAAKEIAKERTDKPPEKLPSELNLMRRRLGMGETGVESGEDAGKSFPRKIYDFMGQRTGIGATAGSIAGVALAPSSGFTSLLIPALLAGAGGAVGAATEGKSPLKEGLVQGGMQAAFHGLGAAAKPAKQFGELSAAKTFAGRAAASEASESLFKKKFTPAEAASELYNKAAATGAVVPLGETASTVSGLLTAQTNRLPLSSKAELQKTLKPLKNFITPSGGKGKTQYLVAQDVKDTIADVESLSTEANTAFKDGKTQLGRALRDVRNSMLNDLDAVGVPEVREASKNWRRVKAIEELSEQIAKPFPGIKLRQAYRDNKLFDADFTKPEREQIDRIVGKLEHFTASGGAGVLGKTITAGAGAAIGAATGLPFAHEIGAGIAYVGAEKFRALLSSPAGRQFLERVLDDSYKTGGGKVVKSIGPVLSIFARGLMSGGEPEQ